MSAERPLIGVTTRVARADDGSLHPNVAPYVRAVDRAGGEARILDNDVSTCAAVLAECAGIVLSGGGDLDPSHYGAERHALTEPPNLARDAFE